MPELLPELPEARASGAARRIYGEIRRLSGVPMVALIYRHLATIPGALEWSWALLEPLLRSGALQRQAWALAAQARVDAVPPAPAALQAAGLGAEDRRAIGVVLAAYNRANPVNILALRCIALHLAGGMAVAGPPEPVPWEPPPAPGPLPPMIDPQAMTPDVRALAMLLTDRGPTATPSTLWPSLYRHLAHWPAFLAHASELVVPRFAAIDRAAALLRTQAESAARELAARTVAPPDIEPPAAAQRERLQAAITQFTGRIPEMVVIGKLLQEALA